MALDLATGHAACHCRDPARRDGDQRTWAAMPSAGICQPCRLFGGV